MEKARDEFQVNWEKLEDFKYYQTHKTAIDKLGGGNSHMKISKSQAIHLMKKTNATYLQYKRFLLDLIGHIKPDDGDNRYLMHGKITQNKLKDCISNKHIQNSNLEREM